MNSEDLKHQIDDLVANNPETGEDWADIAAMEEEYVRLRELEAEADGQFGVGA